MTIVVHEPLDQRETSPFFGPPGTQAPTPTVPRTARVILPLVLGMTLGTVASISPAEALALQQSEIHVTTGAAAGPAEGQAASPGLIAEYVAGLRRRSGLTWGDFARALGVSRRTVHFWASGKRVSPRHLERLNAFGNVLLVHESATPDITRERLMVSEDGGPSPFAALVATHKTGRRTPLSGVALSDVLEADEALQPPSRTADRRSALKAPGIGRGSSESS